MTHIIPNPQHYDAVLGVELRAPGAKLPEQSRPGDAGLDVSAVGDHWINPGDNVLVPTGIALELPRGTVGKIHSRSGLAAKSRVFVLNAPGVIDENYDGEIKVNLMNLGPEPYLVKDGDRIAQLIVEFYIMPIVQHIAFRPPTIRSGQGHGSSGR